MVSRLYAVRRRRVRRGCLGGDDAKDQCPDRTDSGLYPDDSSAERRSRVRLLKQEVGLYETILEVRRMATITTTGAWVPTFPNPGDPPSAVVEVAPQTYESMPSLCHMQLLLDITRRNHQLEPASRYPKAGPRRMAGHSRKRNRSSRCLSPVWRASRRRPRRRRRPLLPKRRMAISA